MGSGAWREHVCSGKGKGASHRWQEAWCHLDKHGAAPREGACGHCPVHCTCSSRTSNNLPKMGIDESVEQFLSRLNRSKSREYSPHNSE